jgi:hypothetical protein
MFLFQVQDDLFPLVCFMYILFQVPDDLFPAVCAAPKWLLNLGFSLGYGAMFTKVQYEHSGFCQFQLNAELNRTFQGSRDKLYNYKRQNVLQKSILDSVALTLFCRHY